MARRRKPFRHSWWLRQLRKGLCPYCGVRLSKETATVDHIDPVSRGGGNHAENVTVACRSCNELKADRSLLEFLLAR